MNHFNTAEQKTSNNRKEKGGIACQEAYEELPSFLKCKYPHISSLYVDIFNNDSPLTIEDFIKVKEFVYVRSKQLLLQRHDLTFKDIYDKDNPFSETDKRMKMSQLIQNFSHPIPELLS